MSSWKLIWKEVWQRPTAMLSSLLTIVLGVAALVAIRNVAFFSERAVSQELAALGANVLVLPQGVTLQDYYSADLHGQTMPEELVQQLAFSNLEGVESLAPKLCVPARLSERGVILTGGGALLDGLDQYLRSYINLAVSVAEEPRYATVNGLVKLFDDPKLLERVTRNELGVLQNAEIPFEA